MPRFDIYSDGERIGWSHLESGDPPMGVASGQFYPLPAYEAMRQNFVASLATGSGSVPAGHRLSAVTSDGRRIESSAGVHIEDYSKEVGPKGLQVTILGITSPSYQSLFPQHVADYEALSRRAG